jgi:L-amino acid N-acyltransferase YncA
MTPVQSATEPQLDMIRHMATPKISLRPAERRDAEAIAAIYAPVVRDTFFSFETEPPSAKIMAERIEGTQRRYPWLVATTTDEVIGYAYASEHRLREAYRWSVDVTAYVAEVARGNGVGRRLYGGLIPMLQAQGFRGAFAGIALPNSASVGLHRAVGFQPLGVYKDVGFKLGAWRDVEWWRLALASGDAPPPELLTFQQLRDTSDFRSFLT